MSKILWLLVSATSAQEAEKIGRVALQKRLCACFGIYPRIKSVYFWPPRSKKLEQSKGPLLVLETLPGKHRSAVKLIKRLHSDKVPFIGSASFENLNKDFLTWMKGELN